jgi:hypothetical protein
MNENFGAPGQREWFWMRYHFFKKDNIEYLMAKPKVRVSVLFLFTLQSVLFVDYV